MNREDFRMPFGKHRGKTLGDILAENPTYLDWLADAEIRSPELAAAICEMNAKYSAEIERALEDKNFRENYDGGGEYP